MLDKITFTIEYSSDGEIFVSNKDFRTFGHGKTFASALHDAADSFNTLYQNYKNNSDASLTKDAISLRNRLKELNGG